MSSDNNQTPWTQHTLEQQPWRNQTQLVAALTLVVVVGIIIGALYLIQTTTTATTARVLDEMSEYRAKLERDNERLRAEIAELQSLPRVMTRAAELGFREADPEEIQYLIVEGYRYDRPRLTPTPTPTPVGQEPIYDETLSGWLHKQWDALKQQFEDWRNGE
jgi:cell division protein FtsL